MSETLKLKTSHVPSYFNKDTLLGGLLALAVGGFIPGGVIVAGLAALGGAVVGGVIGKHRQEIENHDGKTVGEPSFWNKDTVIGGLIGLLSTGIAAIATGLLTIGGLTLASPEIAPTLAVAGIMGMGAALIGTPLLGGYIGGKIGKNRQKCEVEEAKKQTIVAHLSQNVSPEVAKAVEYTMEHNKEWGKEMLEEKLLASAQEPAR